MLHNQKNDKKWLPLCAGVALALAANSAHAAYDYSPFKLSVSRTSAPSAEVGDNGNEFTRDVWRLKLSAAMPVSRQWSVGVNLGYDNLDYGWKVNQNNQLINASVPWTSINRYSVGMSVNYRPNNQWMFMVSPKVQYAYANTASSSNALSYGAVGMGMYRFDSGNMLGLGVAYLNDISEVRTVPYLAVKWQINDKLVLTNPFQAGFSGPAGLELQYQYNDNWDFGIGSSRRTERFLVENDDTTIEIEEWVSFLRAGWKVSNSALIHIYGGYYFAGEMQLSEPDVSQDIENQMAGAIAFEVKF
ncbi:autotransporter outer membrane beta-barrel domain-containing protein [Shewanella intestini]|uniref:Autotransporter outer membrane beta-barrel domain-containing protein n=2 Tax=Shewanellaceae TaxID=267890 RepID=A0ABS5HY93_9GAMM|nr:autotransporter outer membrane beta-barrel domain-containing protein [Shewanella intestini]MRG34710.1 autotransporter outer membrane beta-barrel domain-containing protein [Shewanella sp. XMDDZSB0408]